jgi:hypothetical protein
LVSRTMGAVEAFVAHRPPNDDRTLLAVVVR